MWYCAVSKPSKEVYAAQQLRNQGADTFVPMCLRDVKRRKDAPSEVREQPVLSRYFLFRPNGLAIRTVLSTRGIAGIVKWGSGEPIQVSQEAYDKWVRDASAVQDMRAKAAEYILSQTYNVQTSRGTTFAGELIEILSGKLKFQLGKDYGYAKMTVRTNEAEFTAA